MSPRVGNGYASRYDNSEIVHREDVTVTVGDRDLPPRRRAQFSVGEPDDLGEPEAEAEDHSQSSQFGRVTVTPASPTHSPSSSITLSNGVRVLNASALVTTPPAVQVGEPNESADPYDYFGGPDLGEDFSTTTTPGGRRWTRKPPTSKSTTTSASAASPAIPSSSLSPTSSSSLSSSSAASPPEEEERGRGRERSRSRSRSNSRSHSGSASLSVSRSRSRSRTPSPTFMSSANQSCSPSSVSPEQSSLSPSEVKDGSSSFSSGSGGGGGGVPPKRVSSFDVGSRGGYHSHGHGVSSTGMLSPPLRGRSIANPAQTESRGRSITRTPSSSFSDRDRSSCHSSPIGSLSPEGSSIGLVGGSVFANGRLDRERESSSRIMVAERQQRGRPRVGRSLSSSTSVSPVDYSSSSRDVVSPSLVEAALATVAAAGGGGGGGGVETSRLARSSASSSSSSSTISEASSVATITCASSHSAPGTTTPTTTPMVPSNSTSSSSSSSIPTSNTTSTSISGPAPMSVPVKGMVVPAEPSFHVKREDHDGQMHGQTQEGSSIGIGRAAGMLSSYLGLWPASASASGTSS
ncbi:hypothetical protein ONZ45_g8860 [Pleurotus djamor]|nr:hypothetical protein ONZ45_g8860 [Pleurotus djamor]